MSFLPRRRPVAHRRIYEALKKGDKREAQVAMQEHIVFVRDRLLGSFES
jgi:DNA-binding FadR family transcriptional regulator